MSATNQFEDDLLELLFTNATAPNIGDATGIAGGTVGSVSLSMHTAALAETTTTPATSEASYTGYARQTVARSGAGWTVSAGACTNDAEILFGEKTAGVDNTMEAVGICFSSVAFLQIYNNDPALSMSNGVNPRLAASALSVSLT